MTYAGNTANMSEMIEPILPYIDGCIIVFNGTKDATADYLESIKGEGKIVYREFVPRHDFLMNETLFCGIPKEGDLIIWADAMELPRVKFISTLRGETKKFMDDNAIDCLYYYGKAFVFKFTEHLFYTGSPHWSLQGIKSGIQLEKFYPNEAEVRLNTRPIKRPDPFHFISHYLKYYLYPANANHSLLGLERKQGDLKENFFKREEMRAKFKQLLYELNCNLTVDGVKNLFCQKPLDPKLKPYISGDLILSDFYRFYNLNDKTIRDNHDWSTLYQFKND